MKTILGFFLLVLCCSGSLADAPIDQKQVEQQSFLDSLKKYPTAFTQDGNNNYSFNPNTEIGRSAIAEYARLKKEDVAALSNPRWMENLFTKIASPVLVQISDNRSTPPATATASDVSPARQEREARERKPLTMDKLSGIVLALIVFSAAKESFSFLRRKIKLREFSAKQKSIMKTLKGVGIVFGMSGVAGVIMNAASATVMQKAAWNMAVITLGFFIVGVSVLAADRWKHLKKVAVYSWLTGLSGLFCGLTPGQWAFGIVPMMICMAAGGAVADLVGHKSETGQE